MEMAEDKILLTARYVEGDLQGEERIAYESGLQSDAELQQHLQDYKEIHSGLAMHLAENREFLSILKNNNDRYFVAESKAVKLFPVLKWVSGIAAVLFIGLMIWAPWNQNLYHTYQPNQQMMVAERGEEQNTTLGKAATLFNDKKFDQATLLFAELYKTNPADAMIAYYYGSALVEIGKIDQAQPILTQLYNGKSVYRNDAAYILALGYLKIDNKQEAKTILSKIEPNSSKYKLATEILSKLN
jgi:tetratricopeptide (TPR) repeat protein